MIVPCDTYQDLRERCADLGIRLPSDVPPVMAGMFVLVDDLCAERNALRGEVAALRGEVAALRAEVAALTARWDSSDAARESAAREQARRALLAALTARTRSALLAALAARPAPAIKPIARAPQPARAHRTFADWSRVPDLPDLARRLEWIRASGRAGLSPKVEQELLNPRARIATFAKWARRWRVPPRWLVWGEKETASDEGCRLPRRLAMRRAAVGLTYRAIARRAEVSDSMLSMTLAGKVQTWSVEWIQRVAGALEVAPGWLAYGTR